MKFTPVNKYIYVKTIKNDLKYSKFIPEDLQLIEPWTVANVIEIASDCEKIKHNNQELTIIFNTEGLEKVVYEGETLEIVSEKYVVGFLS